MNLVTADASMQAAFGSIDDVAEVRDPSGTLLGYIAPVGKEENLLYARARLLLGADEIERRRGIVSRDYTIDEVREHLKSLGAPRCGIPWSGGQRH
jgi:hypothetical protein